eukprot:UN02539
MVGCDSRFSILFPYGILPLLLQQMQEVTKMIQATPDVAALNQRLARQKSNSKDKINFMDEISKIKKANKLYFRRFMYYPVVLLGTFLPFVFASRQIIFRHDYDLQQGGFAWFTNLGQPDDFCILPLTCLALTYMAIGLYAGRAFTHEGDARSLMFRVYLPYKV